MFKLAIVAVIVAAAAAATTSVFTRFCWVEARVSLLYTWYLTCFDLLFSWPRIVDSQSHCKITSSELQISREFCCHLVLMLDD